MEHLPTFKAILSAEWIHLPAETASVDPTHHHTWAQTIQDVIKSFRGHLINAGVPTYLCVFPSVFEGILASVELLKISRGSRGPSIRLGLHYGPIDTETGLLRDETTGIAVHIQSFGKTNALVISSAVNEQIKSHPQFKARSMGKYDIHGLPGMTEIFMLFGFGLSPSSGLGWLSKIRASFQKAGTALQSLF